MLNWAKGVLQGLLMVGLVLFLWENYMELLLNWWDSHFLYLFCWEESVFAKVAYVAFLLLCGIRAYFHIHRQYKMSALHIVLFGLVFYLILDLKSLDRYEFLPLWNNFQYVDALMVPCMILLTIDVVNWIKGFSEEHAAVTDNRLLTDNAITELSEDEFEYRVDAERYVQRMKSLPTNQSWSIAVTSSWGGGKTSLINLMQRIMGEDAYIYIHFNPRHSKQVGDIQADFFSALRTTLSDYNSEIGPQIKQYAHSLSLFDKSGFVDKITGLLTQLDAETLKERVGNSISCLCKPVLVVFEDFDRLTPEEVMEVLKLIDGNANFPNIVYMTAYDKDHVRQIFKDYQKEGTNYVDKYFQIEFTVPHRPYRYILDYLSTCINKVMDLSDKGLLEVKAVLHSRGTLIQRYIETPRDVKHFANLLATDYELVAGEVVLEDFLLVKMVKYKYPEQYNLIRCKNYLTKVSNGGVDNWQIRNLADLDKVPCADVIKVLFPAGRLEGNPIPFRSIREVIAFDTYFCNEVYNGLRFSEITDCLAKTDTDQYRKWHDDEGKLNDLVQYIRREWQPDDITSEDDLKHKIQVLIRFYNVKENEALANRLSKLISNVFVTSMAKRFPLDRDSLEHVLFMELDHMDAIPGLHLMNKLICDIVPNDSMNKPKDDAFVAVGYIYDHRTDMFVRYLDSIPEYNMEAENLLRECVVENGHLCPNCCEQARVKIESAPKLYVSSFVRRMDWGGEKIADDALIGCDPIWKSIWRRSDTQLHDFLFRHRYDSNPNFVCARNFYRLFEANGFEFLHFQNMGDVQEKIDKNLVREVEWLDELEAYKDEADKVVNNLPSEISVIAENKGRLDLAMEKIEKIELPESIKENTMSAVQNAITMLLYRSTIVDKK